uniref:Uncharacterized protein n=1 Tax=Proboscia inermis TaxID=420281 RepID=A0A7S0GBQ4_9STRA|mmetsp:Transcript_18023/g.18250  ORF Transcript_18023/g.18250 Transcript_18023/m.18250 type:complete len:277 (+) Transcript_18023:108-938(+)|eukprot:CAMPEP_0171310994 /NCGR_PEP_ID=MMETSP0816-20121228/21206_1 /TAXON_ID=420281 /ORGANISM="Proboscia inermis, Strain CCAP1064/1" /LENGTH=276 /DNA_ID=CAMNT_0011795455 /DNA_START=85 /DNA_END=915 /DNA_ORIENTATION=+
MMRRSIIRMGQSVDKTKLRPAPPPVAVFDPRDDGIPQSSKETMMPWNGWFSSLLQSKLGDKNYQKMREFLLWDANDIHNLEGVPRPNTKIPINKEGTEFAQFRYPSPGNRKAVNIPNEDDEDPYNNAYYPTDTRRRDNDPANPNPDVERLKVSLMDQSNPKVKEMAEKLAAGPASSPGNKGVFATGKTSYDPSGLRAAMSANHTAVNAMLDDHMPNHLPISTWVKREDAIISRLEELGLPMRAGGTGFGKVPVRRRVARWGSEFGGAVYSEELDDK